MAYVTKLMRQKMALAARDEREARGMKKNREMVEVPFEWQTKQTAEAVLFPTYGWVPVVALRWRRDGKELPWSAGRQGDTFLMAKEFAEQK